MAGGTHDGGAALWEPFGPRLAPDALNSPEGRGGGRKPAGGLRALFGAGGWDPEVQTPSGDFQDFQGRSQGGGMGSWVVKGPLSCFGIPGGKLS